MVHDSFRFKNWPVQVFCQWFWLVQLRCQAGSVWTHMPKPANQYQKHPKTCFKHQKTSWILMIRTGSSIVTWTFKRNQREPTKVGKQPTAATNRLQKCGDLDANPKLGLGSKRFWPLWRSPQLRVPGLKHSHNELCLGCFWFSEISDIPEIFLQILCHSAHLFTSGGYEQLLDFLLLFGSWMGHGWVMSQSNNSMPSLTSESLCQRRVRLPSFRQTPASRTFTSEEVHSDQWANTPEQKQILSFTVWSTQLYHSITRSRLYSSRMPTFSMDSFGGIISIFCDLERQSITHIRFLKEVYI